MAGRGTRHREACSRPARRTRGRVGARLVALLALLAACGCAGPRRLRPFTTDGCTDFPDEGLGQAHSWHDCCVLHDMAYWRGGSWAERRQADLELRRCVERATGSGTLAATMLLGVRVGGSALWPSDFRWGYGWLRDRPYAELDAVERRSADEEMERWRRDHPGAPEPPWRAAR